MLEAGTTSYECRADSQCPGSGRLTAGGRVRAQVFIVSRMGTISILLVDGPYNWSYILKGRRPRMEIRLQGISGITDSS